MGGVADSPPESTPAEASAPPLRIPIAEWLARRIAEVEATVPVDTRAADAVAAADNDDTVGASGTF